MLRSKSKSIVSQFVSSASSDLHFKVFQGCIMKGILTLFMKLLKLLGVYVLLFHLAITYVYSKTVSSKKPYKSGRNVSMPLIGTPEHGVISRWTMCWSVKHMCTNTGAYR